MGRTATRWDFVERVDAAPAADPVAALALALSRRKPIPDVGAFLGSFLDPLSEQGLISAAALEGPQGLRSLVLPAHIRSVSRRHIMRLHADRLLDRLQDAGIDAVVLKGDSAARWYSEPLVRPHTDVDLLVRADAVEDALEVFRGDGSVTDVPRQGPEADKRHIMVRDSSGVSFIVDLHWHLFSYHQLRGRSDIAMPEIWAGVRREGNRNILPIEAELAFLASHAVLDHRFRLILFRDIAELIETADIDWEVFVQKTGEWGLRSVAWAALTCATGLADARVPDGVIEALKVRSVPARAFDRYVRLVDPVRFDGRRPHPLNLATVLLHDDRLDRLGLMSRAPLAFGGWQRKVERLRHSEARRAVVLVTSNQRRGAEVFGSHLVGRLRDRGWDARLNCLSIGEGPTVSATPVVMAAPSDVSGLDLAVLRGVRQAIRDADVVLANGSSTLPYTALASRWMLRRPAIVYSSIGEPAYWARSGFRRNLQRMMLTRFDRLTAVSHESRRQLIDDIGVPSRIVSYAPTGIDEMWCGGEDSAGSGELRLVFIGSLSGEKRPDLFLDVLDAMHSNAWHARILGEGPMRDEVEKRREVSRRLRERVEVIGSVPSIEDALCWATCLVQTSESEGLPGVVMEAAAAGRPSVAFDVGGTRELVHDGVTGRLVPFGDVTGMAAILDELAGEPARAHEMGAKARELVAQEYTLDKAVDGYVAAFEKALESRRRGR